MSFGGEDPFIVPWARVDAGFSVPVHVPHPRAPSLSLSLPLSPFHSLALARTRFHFPSLSLSDLVVVLLVDECQGGRRGGVTTERKKDRERERE